VAEITIPSIGIAMEEALLLKWLKAPGDDVAVGEAVAEIETDKATMELESPAAGRLGPHLVEPGAIVPVGAVVVEVLTDGAATETEAHAPAAELAAEPAPVPAAEGVAAAPAPATPADGRRRPHALSPKARRLARERGAQAEPVASGRSDRFRELISAKTAESWRETPHFAVTREVDAEQLLAALASMRATDREPAATVTDLLLRALALALRDCGYGEGHVGLAVATRFGVVNPVVRDVLLLDASSLARARSDATERARAGRLTREDVETVPPCTLSNLGAFGIDQFTGIIPLGQTSLLTVGRAVPRVVADAERRLAVRATFYATLNSDHRTIDGAEAARLLAAFANAVEAATADFPGGDA
jgi:pyruvate dehydrogenase E2 component (dihydrolipoyllysine-residue acetyltransferase)